MKKGFNLDFSFYRKLYGLIELSLVAKKIKRVSTQVCF